MGEKAFLKKGTKLIIDLPSKIAAPLEVQVFKDGVLYYQGDIAHTELDIKSKGVYRVVIRVRPDLPVPDDRPWLGWIYTNPFYIQ